MGEILSWTEQGSSQPLNSKPDPFERKIVLVSDNSSYILHILIIVSNPNQSGFQSPLIYLGFALLSTVMCKKPAIRFFV